MWLELICWICNVFIFHQHILLIVCQPSLNLINNYIICVAGKQWEALRFTIEVRTCMVLCLIAHYCAIAGTILIFRFLTICLAHVGPALRGIDPLFDPFCIWGNEMSMNISQVKKLRKIVRIKKLATKNNKIFVCTMKKTSVNYRMVLTLILPPVLFSLHISFVRSQSISTLTKVIENSNNIQTAKSLFLYALWNTIL